MQKCLILFSLLFCASIWASSTDWNPYVMTHDKFVHLSSEDKEKVIVKMMEMVVELEGKYKKTVVLNAPDKALLERYMVLVDKLQGLLISNAYAEEVSDGFIAKAKAFSTLLAKLKTDGCIYAGYVSRLVNGRCSSPNLLKPTGKKGDSTAAIKAAYLNKSNANGDKAGTCGGTKKISCNPVVFGYKQNVSGAPFCVNTSPDEAHNAAYECMKAALAEDAGDKLTDSKEKRLGYLKAAISDPKAAAPFNKAHKFLFQTCMCEDIDTGLNTVYRKYMKPHRTCFAMLNTLKNIDSQECSALSSKTAIAAFGDEWNNYYGASSYNKQDATKEVPFDGAYKDIVSKPEMKRLCSANPDDGYTDDKDDQAGTECSTKCKKEKGSDGKEAVYCEVTRITVNKDVDGKMVTTEVKKFKEVKLLLEAGKKQLTYSSEDGKENYTCDVVAPEDDSIKGLGCELKKDDTNPKKPVIAVSFTNLKEGQTPPEISWEGKGTASKDKMSFTAESAEKQTITATLGGKAAATTEATTDKTATSAPKTCTIDIGSEDENNDDNFTLTATPSLGPATVNIVALIELKDGEMPADHVIVWVRRGFPAPKFAEEKVVDKSFKNEEETKKLAEEAAKPIPEEPVNPGTPGSKDATIDETRLPTAYKTCAQLRDASQTVIKEACNDIPALSAPRPPGGGAFNRPQQFLTPSYNTRTMGVQ